MKLEIKHRDQLGSVLNEMKLLRQGVEIGVFHGEYASTILKDWKGERLTGIDPYVNQLFDEYRDGCNKSNMEWVMTQMLLRLMPFSDRFHLLRQKSADATTHFVDGFLDFVYIDGNHSLPHIEHDLKAWWPKVKPGGIMGGHDFYTRSDVAQKCDVEKAVEEFRLLHDLEIVVTKCTSWWLVKPLAVKADQKDTLEL